MFYRLLTMNKVVYNVWALASESQR